MAIFCGLIFGIFSAHILPAFFESAAVALLLIWLIDTMIIVQKFGFHLNTLYLTDKIMFNSLEIDPSRITRINIENIYPDSIISKWKITAIRFTLDDHTDFSILGKPHSLFFYIKYIAGIFVSYHADWRKYKKGLQRGFTPLSSYFVRETSQTLDFLVSKYPGLRLKVV
ncbi:hypothetical protein [Chryseobacterium gregarium]|uniref:hypothetical protein n=1 Tax=Chryseobacterium gregarium TaxID=456299 RepID=UPI00138ADFCA|nr:hypothetical protein [Chryseobacterium gregarium]